MTLDPKKIAERLGATHVGEVPDTGGGAFGMARLKAILQERLAPSPSNRPGQPTNVRWGLGTKVPMSRETEALLILLAEKLSTPERRVSPLQLAAQLLEESVQQLTRRQS
jgi:hypothetical protein